MLHIALVRNPIQPECRDEHNTELIAGQSLQEYIDPIIADWPETEFIVSVNGNVIEKDDVVLFYPADGDWILLMPVMGKGLGDIFKSLLMVALLAWAGPAGMAMAGLKAGAAATFMSGLYTGLITVVGGAIINAIVPSSQENASVNYDPSDLSTSYGWNGSTVTETPGTPVGRTYGTVSPTLVRLQRHISSSGSDQYLNLLFSCGSGPVDSIDNITIAGNPIANYENAECWIRLGTNDQDVIANFSDTIDDYPLSYELDNDAIWHTQRTNGNAVQGLEAQVQLPNGLYYTKDDASLGSASVTIDAQYKLAADSVWADWLSGEVISGADNAAIFKTYRKDNLPAGQYDVRMRCTAKSGTTTRYATRIYWHQLSEIMYEDFCYPNLALLGIRIKATDQLSGSDPEVKCTVTRSKVWIWNQDTAAYEQKRAGNPFWAAYDLLHHCEYLKNIQTGLSEFYVEGVPARRFDYYKLAECAAYADELLPSGKYRFELNLFVEGSITVKEALDQIAMVGRGKILPRGTKFSCICDMPQAMSMVFCDANITDKSMSGEWQGIENRARSVEVSFWNKSKNYTKDMVPYFSDAYNDDNTVPNPTQLTYRGITDEEHAYREAAYNGRCNEYKERTKTWQADICAIGCMIGDVVGVQTQTSMWGTGGRIVSATSNSVTLDRKVTLTAGSTYKIYLTLADDTMVTRTVAAVAEDTETDTLTLTEAFETIPEKFDLFAVTNELALMRILSIVRAKDQKAKITAEQYFAEIYEDNLVVPQINYADLAVKSMTVAASEVLPRPSASTPNVLVTWVSPRDSRASKVNIYANGVLKKTSLGGTYGSEIIPLGTSPSYTIRVDATDAFGTLVATGSAVFASTYAVSQVTGLTCVQAYREIGDGTIGYELTLIWMAPTDRTFASADVYMRSNLATADELGALTADEIGDVAVDRLGLDVVPWKQIGSGVNKFTLAGCSLGATYKFMVVAKDANGISADAADAPTVEYTVAVKPYTPIMPSGFTLSVSDKVYASWAANTDTDVDYYELRTNTNAGSATGRLYRGTGIQCTPELASRAGTLYLYAHNPSGHYSAPLIYEYSYPAPVAPTITIADMFQGFVVTSSTFPLRALSLNVHIDGAVYKSPNNQYRHSVESGVFFVSAAFADYFGEGSLSAEQTVTVIPTIPPALIAEESLALSKMDTTMQNSLKSLSSIVSQFISLVGDASGYSGIAQVSDDIQLRVVDANGQVSLINISPNTITINGQYVHITGDTVFDNNVIVEDMLAAGSVTAEKMSVTSLSAITATIGTLRTATSGARTEIADNIIRVYDANNVLRVRMGVW